MFPKNFDALATVPTTLPTNPPIITKPL
jgi:hypothetical protein